MDTEQYEKQSLITDANPTNNQITHIERTFRYMGTEQYEKQSLMQIQRITK